ncbi:hypothetical protein HDU79_010939 [Rhizoclosmatium sp. JEL0117]|nr:hypothetical protein HDU79_010939 [Rhizoclosmatium sp. JEL0117]
MNRTLSRSPSLSLPLPRVFRSPRSPSIEVERPRSAASSPKMSPLCLGASMICNDSEPEPESESRQDSEDEEDSRAPIGLALSLNPDSPMEWTPRDVSDATPRRRRSRTVASVFFQ